MIRNFKSLKIWQRSRVFVKTIYDISNSFPSEEKFGLISQINRASVSIPSNIAEGCGRSTVKDLSRFLDIAVGSTCEVETQLYLSFDQNFISNETLILATDEITQIRKMIIGYKATLK